MRFSRPDLCLCIAWVLIAFAGLQSVCASIDKCQPGKWALTFDDGPDRRNTLDLLIALKRNNVHATFFIVGCNVEENSDILKGIHADGHEVAVHTWNHPDLTTQTDDEIREQINSTMSVIYKTIGVKPTLMRPPYGYTNERVNRIMVELDLEVILWNVDSKDWKHVDMYGENETAWEATKQTMLTYLHKMNPEKDGGISLQHDKHRASVEKLDEIIDAVRKEGYDLSTVTQCISDRGGYSSPTVIRRVYSAS
ncbi:hypothetical protein IWQ62_000525 [Dispira parvispora]|uniref:NodB homology domain-containing protein n=1 Tax=Dispira parvispora TaxID=1520584 RepID=A0A9W8AWV7_9FUNG|nr:hypothetical protein IWQ62_000525 [Dispira parvispora]